MNNQDIITQVIIEMRKQKKSFPNWPEHVVGQVGVVSMHSNKMLKTAIDIKYKSPDKKTVAAQRKQLMDDAVATAASALRLIEQLSKV